MMHSTIWIQKTCRTSACALAMIVIFSGWAGAQVPPGTPAGTAPATVIPAAELEQLVGPIALYPDDLLAIMLPASTYPLEIVKAQRFLEQRKTNPKLEPDKSMPEPVLNLLNYPDVVKNMSDDLDWTQRLGEAVVSQQQDVLAAIQSFRRQAYSAGNLKTDDKQIVVQEKEIIQVVPADPEVVYVPQYQTETVVVAQPAPPVSYYPTPYPSYYYPYPTGVPFGTGFFWGAATAYAFDWDNGDIDYDVNVDRTANLNTNRDNPRYQQAADQARQTAQQRRASQPETAGRQQTWRSEKQPGQIASGRPRAGERQAARPGDAQFGLAGGARTTGELPRAGGVGAPGVRPQTGTRPTMERRGAGGQLRGQAPQTGSAFSRTGAGPQTFQARQRGSASLGGSRSGFGGARGGGGMRGGGGARGGGGMRGGGGRRR